MHACMYHVCCGGGGSYHHQAAKQLASSLSPMGWSPDGIIEGLYDKEAYNPNEGKFRVGLQVLYKILFF